MNYAIRKVRFYSPAILIVILAIGLSGCATRDKHGALSGVIETDKVDIAATLSAPLVELRVDEGDVVLAGDTLALLDTVVVAAAYRSSLAATLVAASRLSDLEAGADQEEIRVAKSRHQLAQESLSQARRDLARSERLHQEKLTDDRTLETSRLQVLASESAEKIASEELANLERGARVNQLAAARATLRQAEAEATIRQRAFTDAFLISPQGGVVQLLPYQLGETVPAGRTVVTVSSAEHLWIKIYLPEELLGAVSIGDSLSLQVDAYPQKTFTGVVSFISSSAEFTPRNVQSPDERINLVFAVKLTVESAADSLRPGMPADVFLP